MLDIENTKEEEEDSFISSRQIPLLTLNDVSISNFGSPLP